MDHFNTVLETYPLMRRTMESVAAERCPMSIKLKSYEPIFFFSHTFVFIGCLQANYYKSLFSDYFCFSFPLFFPFNLKFIPADGCESICDLVVSCAVFIQPSLPIQSENGSSRQRDDCLSLRRRQEQFLETQISSLHYCRKIEIEIKVNRFSL